MDDEMITLWQNELYPEETVKTPFPLSSYLDLNSVKEELGIPDYVDSSYFPMERAIVTLWVAKNCPKIRPDLHRPVQMLLFGGGAIKLHCPSANAPGSPLNRPINDIDFIISKRAYRDVKEILGSLGDYAGTRYTHFFTPFDRRFNGFRGGRRIMAHCIHEIDGDGMPQVGIVDILVDHIEMRHTIDVRQDLKEADAGTLTIRLHNLLLSKAQMIFEVKPMELTNAEEYRVLNAIYKYFPEGRVIMGMEKKDILDVCAILLDHDLGTGPDQLDIDAMNAVLRKDKKLSLTVRLNLKNTLRNLDSFLGGEDVVKRKKIEKKVLQLLEAIPDTEARWSRPWWNTAVDTPAIV